jgi:hypothetical protein
VATWIIQFGWASSQLLADVQVMVRSRTWGDVKYDFTPPSMKLAMWTAVRSDGSLKRISRCACVMASRLQCFAKFHVVLVYTK